MEPKFSFDPRRYMITDAARGSERAYTVRGSLAALETGEYVVTSTFNGDIDGRGDISLFMYGVEARLLNDPGTYYTPEGRKVIRSRLTGAAYGCIFNHEPQTAARRSEPYKTNTTLWLDHDHNIVLPMVFMGATKYCGVRATVLYPHAKARPVQVGDCMFVEDVVNPHRVKEFKQRHGDVLAALHTLAAMRTEYDRTLPNGVSLSTLFDNVVSGDPAQHAVLPAVAQEVWLAATRSGAGAPSNVQRVLDGALRDWATEPVYYPFLRINP